MNIISVNNKNVTCVIKYKPKSFSDTHGIFITKNLSMYNLSNIFNMTQPVPPWRTSEKATNNAW